MTWCGMLGVRGGRFTDFVFIGVSFAVTSSGFVLADVVFFVTGFFAVAFAVVFLVCVVFFVAMIGLLWLIIK
jgi:hypothetical protein